MSKHNENCVVRWKARPRTQYSKCGKLENGSCTIFSLNVENHLIYCLYEAKRNFLFYFLYHINYSRHILILQPQHWMLTYLSYNIYINITILYWKAHKYSGRVYQFSSFNSIFKFNLVQHLICFIKLTFKYWNKCWFYYIYVCTYTYNVRSYYITNSIIMHSSNACQLLSHFLKFCKRHILLIDKYSIY